MGLDVTGIAKLFAVPFFNTLQSHPAYTLAIPPVKQCCNRFAVKINQPVIRLVFVHARQTALLNHILWIYVYKLLSVTLDKS